MSFELREHTADIAVEADGDTLGETFAAVADGMAAAICDEIPDRGERFSVSVSAESRGAALFDYLDELIYQRDVRAVLPVENRASVESTTAVTVRNDAETAALDQQTTEPQVSVAGSARGVPLEDVTAREIKAVTYSELTIEQTDDGWRAYVVFDV